MKAGGMLALVWEAYTENWESHEEKEGFHPAGPLSGLRPCSCLKLQGDGLGGGRKESRTGARS